MELIPEAHTRGQQKLDGGPIEWIKIPFYSKDNVLN